MPDLSPHQQENFTTRFYYSCLYNSLVLFAAPPAYLRQLDKPLFDVVFELESEYSYAFGEPVFSENFQRGNVAEALRQDLLLFKQEIELLPSNLWNWEAILENARWQAIRLKAEELLQKLGEARRTYDLSFTTIIQG